MKRVLVPIDGSEQAEDALLYSFELFPDAEIHVLHVVQVTDFSTVGGQSGYQLAVDEGRKIQTRATELAATHGREVEPTMTEGHAAKTILSYVDEYDVDHIVMGSTGQSGITRLLLGSTAESVARRGVCPVTIVQ